MKHQILSGITCVLFCAIVAYAQPGPATKPVTAEGATIEKLAGDFAFTEGCTADKDGNIYFVDQPNNRIMKWDVTEKKISEFMKPSGYSNGMTFDGKGMLLACADEKNEMWSIDVATKQHTVILKDFDGKYLNGPNDVWVQPTSGRIYFTDPYYRRNWWTATRGERIASEIPQCVYMFEPGGKPARLVDDLRQPNGIIGSPDGKKLYIADIGARRTFSYDIKADGTLENKQPFCDLGSDGMTIDSEGNVYFTSRTVQIFDKTGKKVQDITFPESPANVCFGGKDMQTLFVTARTGFYSIRMRVKGVGPQ